MKCEVVSHYPGVTAIVCGSRRAKRRLCLDCLSEGTKTDAPLLCDFPVTGAKTCDRPLCAKHARPIARGIDHCRSHEVAKP